MEGRQVTMSSLVSEGEAMLVAEIIKLGLRQGLEDLPSSKGPCCPASRSRFLGFIFLHLFPYLFVHLLAYEPAPNGHRGAFLMRSTCRFAADSDSCRGVSSELTPRRLGGSLVLVTESRESPVWIWQSAADRCYF